MRLPAGRSCVAMALLCALGAGVSAQAQGPNCPRALAATQKAPKAVPAAAAAKKEEPRRWRLEAL